MPIHGPDQGQGGPTQSGELSVCAHPQAVAIIAVRTTAANVQLSANVSMRHIGSGGQPET